VAIIDTLASISIHFLHFLFFIFFYFCLGFIVWSPLLVLWWIVLWIIISSSFPFISSTLVLSYLLGKGSFTSQNDLELVRWDWWFFIKNSWFFLVIRSHEISSEYLLKLRSLYCYCRTIFEAWKIKNFFSNIWYFVIF